ncbi:MAG: OadG family protein [Candidatus Methanofastidiosia archaeon]|jgi:sodium pump decarboxylase gamma subunit
MDISGFVLTVVGMGVVFSALALLAVTAWVLERVFRENEKDVQEKERRGKKIKIEKERGKETTKDIKAVIAVALAYHTKKKGIIYIHGTNESLWMQQTRGFE